MKINSIIAFILDIVASIIHLPVSILAFLFKFRKEWDVFRIALSFNIWLSPKRLFFYSKRKIDGEKILVNYIYLHKQGISIEIEKLENAYLEGKNLERVAINTSLFFQLVEKDIEKCSELAGTIDPFYKYEGDDIFEFHEKPIKIHLVDILSDKIKDKNLRMYIEFSSDSDFETVMEKTYKGFSLQGSLRPDISKLLRQYDTKQEIIDEIVNNREEVVTYINQNIDKEKYAFDINNLSLGLVKMNEVADLLNEHYKKETNNTDNPFIATEIDSEDIETYLYIKNDQKIEDSQ